MKTKTYIEKAIAKYYKVSVEDLYNTKNEAYPVSGARSVLMYLLYKDGMKMYDIMRLFDYKSSRTVEMRVATVSSVITHNNGKFADDVKAIQELLNSKK